MRLDLGPSIETIRAEALALVDQHAVAAAEAIRPAYHVPMDALRVQEAREALNTTPRNGNADRFPALDSIPGAAPIQEKARAVMDAADQVARQRFALEAARLAAKAAIRTATTVAAIRAIALESHHR